MGRIGVLIRGGLVLPPTKMALRKLQGENDRGEKVPFILLTNGGGVDEKTKAEQLSHKFDIELSPSQIVLAHTPMKLLAEKQKRLREGVCLVVGPDACKNVALQYGFKNPVLPGEVLAAYPAIWPFLKPNMPKPDIDFESTPFSSVIVFHDSRDWGRDIQIICDVLRSDKGYLGSLSQFHHTPGYKQSVPIYFSNPDFIWSNDFSVPRLAQGAFKAALEHLYTKLTGHHIEITEQFGKPFPPTYAFTEHVFNQLDPSLRGTKRRIYAVGDNIASDIVGANLAGWHSVLVRTGVWKDEDANRDPTHFYIPKSIEESMSPDSFRQLSQPKTIADDIGASS